MLHPDYPIVEGRYQFLHGWSLDLSGSFNRRVDDGDLYIWRPGLTIVLAVWANDNAESPCERLKWIRDEMAPGAYDVREVQQDGMLRLQYRLHEDADDARVDALYGYAIAATAHLQIAFYFDDESALGIAQDMLQSVEFAGAG